MARVSLDSLKQMMLALQGVISAVNPAAAVTAAIVINLVEIATNLNNTIAKIRGDMDQKPGESDADYNKRVGVLWKDVSTKYKHSLNALRVAIADREASKAATVAARTGTVAVAKASDKK